MAGEIRPIGPGQPGEIGKPLSPSPAPGEKSFKDILSESIDHVNQLQKDADLTLEKMQRGEMCSRHLSRPAK